MFVRLMSRVYLLEYGIITIVVKYDLSLMTGFLMHNFTTVSI